MSGDIRPSLEQFLLAPHSVVAEVAPHSMIFAAGGTRRAAALAGIPLGEAVARWSQPQMLNAFQLFFQLGVRHLFAPSVRPQMLREQGAYRDLWMKWLHWGLAGPESLERYRAAGWRVRLLIAGEPSSELAEIAAILEEHTQQASGPTLWYLATLDLDQEWAWQAAAFRSGARTRADAVRLLFGEEVPPADLVVSFGKPIVGPDLFPTLLVEEAQCYWMQRPGYALDERQIRRIFYDYAFMRPTWREDKTGRAEEALDHRLAWERGPTVGLGRRLGPFWYPVVDSNESLE